MTAVYCTRFLGKLCKQSEKYANLCKFIMQISTHCCHHEHGSTVLFMYYSNKVVNTHLWYYYTV